MLWCCRYLATDSLRMMIRIASLALVAYWALIFTLTHLPSRTLPKLDWSDKVYHSMAFFGLAFLLAWAIPKRSSKLGRHLIFTFCIAVTYATLDELTQNFIPGRTCDVWDVVADACGASIGLAAYVLVRSTLLKFSLGRGLIQRLSH